MTRHFSPAFPEAENVAPGLDVREYFAAQALAGILANPQADLPREETLRRVYADMAAAMADALVVALNALDVAP